MRCSQDDLIAAIEPLLDQSSLADVLLAIARVCNEKAEHLRCNWQDEASAKVWDKAAKRIDELSINPNVVMVSS